MTNNIWKWVAIASLAVAAVAIYFAWTANAGLPLGATPGMKLIEQYDPYVKYNGGIYTALPFETTSTVQFGSSGTAQANQVSTTCSPIANNSIAASSTGYAYCTGVTGVTSSDNVIAMIATSTAHISVAKDNFVIVAAQASSTAGDIDLTIANWTGAAAVPSAVGRAASTTAIWASH